MLVKLSNRLQMSIDMVKKAGPYLHERAGGTVVADIGCDHAHTCIRLVQEGLAGRCIGMDVRTGPLEKAEQNLTLYGCSDRVLLRLSYGLDELVPGEADVIIIAGMGGELIRDILERDFRGADVCNTEPEPILILQPHSHIHDVRRWLDGHGYYIEDEDICMSDDKYYPVILARKPGSSEQLEGMCLSETEILFGPRLLEQRNPILGEFIETEYRKKKYLLEQIEKSCTAEAAIKRAEVETLYRLVCDARERYR